MSRISLVSPTMKREALFSFWSKVFLLWGVAIFIVCFIGVILLVPAWYYVYQTKYASALAATPEESAMKKSIEMNTKELQLSLLELKTVAASADVEVALYFDHLKEAALLHKDSVVVTRYAFNGEQAAKKTVTISGTAKTREALVSFVRAIQKESMIKGVELPVADLAGRNNEFPFTITGEVAKTP